MGIPRGREGAEAAAKLLGENNLQRQGMDKNVLLLGNN